MFRSYSNVRAILVSLAVIVAISMWLGFAGEANQAQTRKVAPTYGVPSRFLANDAVTDVIRSTSSGLFHVPVSDDAERDRAATLGKIISDHGKFVIVAAERTTSPDRLGAFKIDSTINLPGKAFDPINDPPSQTIQPGAASRSGKGYFVVQLGGIATDEVLDSIRGMGLEVLQYVPNNAFLVYGDAENAARVAGHSRVRWIGEYAAGWKIASDLAETPTVSKNGNAMYNISVFSRADIKSVTDEVVKVSGGQIVNEVVLPTSFFNSVRVAMNPSMVASVAQIADIVRIDSYAFPTAEDERAAHIVAGNYTSTTTLAAPGYNPFTQFGVDGTNVTIAMVDDGVSIPGNGGFYITSANTIDAPLRGATAGAGGGHGHINASIISGNSPFGGLDPLGYNYGLGVAPNSHILNIPLLKAGYSGSDAIVANDTVTTAGPNGVTGSISNNSWGNGTNGNVYESMAATYDSLARDASTAATIDQLLYVFSAGNNGPLGHTRPKMAKNIIAVANADNLRTELSVNANNIDDMASGSARGPAADGRIKPDISAPGSWITGSRAGTCGSVSSCFEANHAWSSGTSHAAPQIAGVAALFEQYWKSTHAGMRPNIALTKAAILQTGQEMNGVGTSASIPNGVEGWGRANMKFMLNTGVPMKYVDQTVPFASPGDNIVYNGRVADGSKPFRATLVWTDPPGVADPALVNNLDIAITINGNTYRGNNFTSGLSVPGGSADTLNNVEHIWINGLATDTNVSISVSASALNGDGIPGNGDATDQHFALVVYNYTEAAPSNFNITGRIVSQGGRPIANAIVKLTSGPTEISRARTNTFGYYTLYSVPGGATYTANVTAKRYTFNSQQVVLGSSDLDGVDFTPASEFP